MTDIEAQLAARIRAAAALRRLGHAVVGHDADPALLDRVAEAATATAEMVEQGEQRSRPIESLKRRLWEAPPVDGGPMSHFDECVVSGTANPMGIAIKVRREGDEAVADFNLGAAFEGAPRRAHGGIVAAIFDDVMGYVLVLHRVPAFTGRLTVNYRAPVPVAVDMTVRARLEHRSGRKLFMTSEMRLSDDPEHPVICEAEGLFVAIPPERFGVFVDESAEGIPGTPTPRAP
jgi:acyl-coenzyme A thioesterase PaaI-like protein